MCKQLVKEPSVSIVLSLTMTHIRLLPANYTSY